MNNSFLDILATTKSICRVLYDTPNENSTDVLQYGWNGEAMGYPETDASLRKRMIGFINEQS